MKIAILINENFNDRKGSFNATHSRILNLTRICKHTIDVYCIHVYEPWHIRKLRHTKPSPKPKIIELDGIKYHILYYRFWLIDYILRQKLGGYEYLTMKALNKFIPIFKPYDLIISHGYFANVLSLKIKKRYNIPYTSTWHGSDIHSAPFENKNVFKEVNKILENSNMNLFVSKNLYNTANKITQIKNGTVLYNGVNKTKFHQYSKDERLKIKAQYQIPANNRNIAFIGNLFPIKNVLCLPSIFKKIQIEFPDTLFHFIGDGSLKHQLINKCHEYDIPVRFWGNVQADNMPDIMNCMDLIVLPSINEGLPLVSLESLACGVHFVGAKVGGIAEAIDDEFCVEHGDSFEERFAKCCIKALNAPKQELKDIFDWETIAKQENKLITNILNNK